MCAVIWALSIALVFGATLLLAALRVDQVGAATLRRLAWWAELADQFRADVARADARPQAADESPFFCGRWGARCA
jgi:hypothetical protein